MPRKGAEIINLHVGQAGCQLGRAFWEMLCIEHNIRPDGFICSTTEHGYESFCYSSSVERVIPRASFIDLEPTVIDDIRLGRYRGLFKPQNLISGKEDAANCFAKGYITLAGTIMDMVLNRIRSMADECNALQGFLVFRAFGGGTGSGLGARLLEKLHQAYPKCTILEFAVYPAPKLSSIVVEPYNTSLTTHGSLEHSSGTFIVDNEACYDICDRLLNIRSPSYMHINWLMGQVICNVTSSFRFEGNLNADLNEMKTNLMPFPRVQYPILGYSPLLPLNGEFYESVSESALLSSCFQSSNQLVKCDMSTGKYMSCAILYRGDVSPASVNSAVNSLKKRRSISFVDWSPLGFKVGVNERRPLCVPNGFMTCVTRSCLLLANSTAVKSLWARVNHKFDLMFEKKAFLHWYLEEGLEESDFQETRLDLATLEDEYEEIQYND